jgi:hypothetical protein
MNDEEEATMRLLTDDEIREFTPPFRDVYDPEEPLANLGWPVMIRVKLFRVDDEILICMEGQPDLRWEEFDFEKAIPAPPEVLEAETDGKGGRP